MLKMFKIASRVELWALASLAFTMSACGVFWAGGVDEETNTVAAADTEETRHDAIASADSLVVEIDTSYFTNQPIEIIKPPETEPQLIITNPEAVHDDTPSIPSSSTKLHDFTGKLNNVNEPLNITVKLNDGDYLTTQTDVSGNFQLDALPVGVYPLIVPTGKSNTNEVAYLLKNSSTDKDLLGPVPSSAITFVKESDFKEPALQNFDYQDGATSIGSSGPSPEPNPESSGSSQLSSSSNQIINHSSGSSIMASNDMPHDADYGVIYSWNAIANGSTEEETDKENIWYNEWTIEVNFELSSIDYDNNYRRNIFGKSRGSDGILALTIINGVCGTEAPSYALFVLRQEGFNCSEAVISTAEVETGKNVFLTGTYDGIFITLYKDGFKIAERYVGYKPLQDLNTSPFVFGDEELDLKLKDVRLGEKAITSADVLYRYYQLGGAQ